MTLAASVRPRGPYSLALTARFASDATRVFRDGVLDALVPGDRGAEHVRAWQRRDGNVELRAASEGGLERLRFVLALDDDHSEFLRRFRADPLVGRAVVALRGLRQLRVATVEHALLRALCGQLIDWRRAKQIESRVIRTVGGRRQGLSEPPTAATLRRLAPAELRRLGVHARRGATLARLCEHDDLERLRAASTSAAVAWLRRQRGLGPWSAGVVCLQGLGRHEFGLVGDLGLIKLASALEGREVGAEATERLLEPYGEWAGLASVYLLAGFVNALIPVPDGSRLTYGRHRPPVAAA